MMLFIAFALLAGLQLVRSHSWVDQLTLIDSDGSFAGKPGYPRGYVPRNAPGFNDGRMVNLIPPNGRPSGIEILPTDSLCKQTQQTPNQSDGFPRLSAPAGGLIALRYQENGHVSLPQGQPGKPPNRGTIYIYSTTEPSPSDTLLSIHKIWNINGDGGDKRGKLLATQNFDDAQCHQVNGGAISQQRQKDFPHPSDALQGQDLWCQNNIKIPQTADTSKPLTLYWVWDWPTAAGSPGYADGKPEVYTTCMDIDVTDGSKAPSYGKKSEKKKAVKEAAGQVNVAAAGIPSLIAIAMAETSANMAAPTTVADYLGKPVATTSSAAAPPKPTSSSAAPPTTTSTKIETPASGGRTVTVTATATTRKIITITATSGMEPSSKISSESKPTTSLSQTPRSSTSQSSTTAVAPAALPSNFKTVVLTQVATFLVVPEGTGASLMPLQSSASMAMTESSALSSSSVASSIGISGTPSASTKAAEASSGVSSGTRGISASSSVVGATVLSDRMPVSTSSSSIATSSTSAPSTSTSSRATSSVTITSIITPQGSTITSALLVQPSYGSFAGFDTSIAKDSSSKSKISTSVTPLASSFLSPASGTPTSLMATASSDGPANKASSTGTPGAVNTPGSGSSIGLTGTKSVPTLASIASHAATGTGSSTTMMISTIATSTSCSSTLSSTHLFEGVELTSSTPSSASLKATSKVDSSKSQAPTTTPYIRLKRAESTPLPSASRRVVRFRNMRA